MTHTKTCLACNDLKRHFTESKWSDDIGCYIHYWIIPSLKEIFVRCRDKKHDAGRSGTNRASKTQ